MNKREKVPVFPELAFWGEVDDRPVNNDDSGYNVCLKKTKREREAGG